MLFNRSVSWTVFSYGLIVALLGLAGYQTSHSKVSLIMGLSLGVLLIASSFLLFAKKKAGFYSALILTLLLTATFSYRYIVTEKVLPAFLAVLSGAVLLFLLAKSAKYKKL